MSAACVYLVSAIEAEGVAPAPSGLAPVWRIASDGLVHVQFSSQDLAFDLRHFVLSLVSSAVVQANSLCALICVTCSGANELDIGGNNDLDVCLELAEVGDSKEERGEWSSCCCSTNRHTAQQGCITSAMSAAVCCLAEQQLLFGQAAAPSPGCGGCMGHACWDFQVVVGCLEREALDPEAARGLLCLQIGFEWMPA